MTGQHITACQIKVQHITTDNHKKSQKKNIRACQNPVHHSTPRQTTAQKNRSHHNIPKHNTEQQNTAQHSTTQHKQVTKLDRGMIKEKRLIKTQTDLRSISNNTLPGLGAQLVLDKICQKGLKNVPKSLGFDCKTTKQIALNSTHTKNHIPRLHL